MARKASRAVPMSLPRCCTAEEGKGVQASERTVQAKRARAHQAIGEKRGSRIRSRERRGERERERTRRSAKRGARESDRERRGRDRASRRPAAGRRRWERRRKSLATTEIRRKGRPPPTRRSQASATTGRRPRRRRGSFWAQYRPYLLGLAWRAGYTAPQRATLWAGGNSGAANMIVPSRAKPR